MPLMYVQTLQQQMRPDWNAAANMLAVTIVSLNPIETYGHSSHIPAILICRFNRQIHICV